MEIDRLLRQQRAHFKFKMYIAGQRQFGKIIYYEIFFWGVLQVIFIEIALFVRS